MLPELIEIALKTQEEKERGQISLFESIGEGEGTEQASVEYPKIEDFSDHEKLRLEKELLGFFLSGDPMERFALEIRSFATANSRQVEEMRPKTEVSLVGMIKNVKVITDRSGNPMAFITLEDSGGTVECTLFHKTLSKFGESVETDKIVYLRGETDQRNGRAQVIASKILPVETLRTTMASMVRITLDADELTEHKLQSLSEIIERHRGKLPVEFCFITDEGKVKMSCGNGFRVEISDDFVSEVKGLFRQNVLTLSGG
jgi:DNA polymerase-3 subunit alpha